MTVAELMKELERFDGGRLVCFPDDDGDLLGVTRVFVNADASGPYIGAVVVDFEPGDE